LEPQDRIIWALWLQHLEVRFHHRAKNLQLHQQLLCAVLTDAFEDPCLRLVVGSTKEQCLQNWAAKEELAAL
jgi:hypothetical protein